MGKLVLVCVGGSLGSGARHLVATMADAVDSRFPLGTLIVNVAGPFLIAVVVGLSLHVTGFPPGLRLFLTTSVMGGYTRYSSFNAEALRLAEPGALFTALVYIAATVTRGILAGLAGPDVARLGARAAMGELA